MSDLHAQMEQIRREHDTKEAELHNQQKETEEAKRRMTNRVQSLLNGVFHEFVSGDVHLKSMPLTVDQPGFTIMYAHTPTEPPSYTVTAKCEAESVEIDVKDGHWQQMPNVFNKYADWMDTKTVYAGEYNEARIQKTLQKSFLYWYADALDK